MSIDHTRSTGNRRAVRNALFREMLTRPRKLSEAELYRLHIVTGPPMRTQLGPMIDTDTARMIREGVITAAHIAPLAKPVEPEPHPWVRLWRRLVWGA